MEPEESDLRNRLTEFPLGTIHILRNHIWGKEEGFKDTSKIVKKSSKIDRQEKVFKK
jgi:hypothetical protein